jgi:hypothetical protein
MNGALLRGLRSWMARAASSLPVPVSPRRSRRCVGRAGQRFANGKEELLAIKKLEDEIGRARLHRLDGEGHGALGR